MVHSFRGSSHVVGSWAIAFGAVSGREYVMWLSRAVHLLVAGKQSKVRDRYLCLFQGHALSDLTYFHQALSDFCHLPNLS